MIQVEMLWAWLIPLLDNMMYQVTFTGGQVTELSIHIIVKSIYTQVDEDRNGYFLLNLIVNYHKDDKAIFLTEQQISIHRRAVTHKFTAGQQICCQWKHCSTSWEKLSILKRLHSVQGTESAVAQVINHQPALKNWLF